MQALLFIDTNIFLDLYRIPTDSAMKSSLNHINENHNKIITGTQIEMEYKKNRQKVIIDSISKMKKSNEGNYSFPAILSGTMTCKSVAAQKKKMDKQSKSLLKRMESVLRCPSKYDEVYKVLNRLFKSSSSLNLKRPNKKRFKIRHLAKKRFILGYPPRKDNDIIIGDAINWEWIIDCATEEKASVVIISRDLDYGSIFQGEPIIDDWLAQEFKERVNRSKSVTLTNKLAQGFELAGIRVSKSEKAAEEKMLEEDTKKVIVSSCD